PASTPPRPTMGSPYVTAECRLRAAGTTAAQVSQPRVHDHRSPGSASVRTSHHTSLRGPAPSWPPKIHICPLPPSNTALCPSRPAGRGVVGSALADGGSETFSGLCSS